MRLLPFTLLWGCRLVARVQELDVGALDGVRIVVEAGDLRVTGVGEAVHLTRTERAPVGGAVVTERVVDGWLEIEATCSALIPCAVDIDLELPASMQVDLRTDQGDVWLANLAAPARVEVGTGDVSAQALGEDFRLHLGRGAAWLQFAVAPVDVAVGVGAGDVRLLLPDGEYRLDLDRTARIEGVRSVAGPARVHVRAAAGRTVVARS